MLRVRPLRPPPREARPAQAPLIDADGPWHTALPARPFAVVASRDGGRAFVSMPRPGKRGFCVLSAGRPWQLDHVHWLPDSLIPRGVALARGERHLLAASSTGALIVADAARLSAGAEDPIITVLDSPGAGSMQVCLDGNDRLAFVSDEDSASVSVFDFGDSLSSDAPTGRLLGQAPVPAGPVGLAVSGDGRHLLVACQGGPSPGGVLAVLSTRELANDPGRARARLAPAGADPVRVAVSPAGDVAWVSARGSNSLLAFDTAALAAGHRRALRAVVRVGAAPVGVATLHGGAVVVAANSNRYDGPEDSVETVSVVDAQAALAGRPALIGFMAAGAFPREIAALPGGAEALLTNVRSQSLQAISVVP